METYQYIILLAGIVSLVTYRVSEPAYISVLRLLLLLTTIVEVWVIPYVRDNHLFNRNIVYSLFSLVDMGCWFFILYFLVRSESWVTGLLLLGALSAFGWSFIELYSEGLEYLHINSFRYYQVIVILFCLYYLYLLLQKEYHPIIRDPDFWICSACIMYQSLLFLGFTTLKEINFWKLKNADEVFRILRNITNVFYYLLLCFACLAAYYKYNQRKQPFI